MRNRVWIIALLFFSVQLLPAYQSLAATEAHEPTEHARHQGMGKVVSVDRAKMRIKLAHEPIKSIGWSRMMMELQGDRCLAAGWPQGRRQGAV